MNYAIVYSSKTGNTACLAEELKRTLPKEKCVYCGGFDDKAGNAELIFVGFWTNKGSCDETSAAFLEKLHGKQVFLFGTAGFGGSEEYFSQILSRVRTFLDSSNKVAGTYMCQGRMPATVRERYEAMKSQNPEKAQVLIANFDRAQSHPDKADLEGLRKVLHANEPSVMLHLAE